MGCVPGKLQEHNTMFSGQNQGIQLYVHRATAALYFWTRIYLFNKVFKPCNKEFDIYVTSVKDSNTSSRGCTDCKLRCYTFLLKNRHGGNILTCSASAANDCGKIDVYLFLPLFFDFSSSSYNN